MTQYEPKTWLEKLGWLIEKCGDVQVAAGKTIRRGLDSWNPELHPEQKDWMLGEISGLKGAIERVEQELGSGDRMRTDLELPDSPRHGDYGHVCWAGCEVWAPSSTHEPHDCGGKGCEHGICYCYSCDKCAAFNANLEREQAERAD